MCVCDIRGKRGEGENETRDKVENRKEEGASEEDRGTKQTWSGVEWVMDAGKGNRRLNHVRRRHERLF